jgi:glycosyltransferase involved in cell wall biosynthesis
VSGIKKIALLTDGIYPFIIGGMQRHSYFLAKYFARRKIHTRIYHCIQAKDESSYHKKLSEAFSPEEQEYLEFVKIPFDFSSYFPGYYLWESYRYSYRIFRHLVHDISEFDFIYTKGFTGWYLLKHRKRSFPPVGVNLHGYEMYQYAHNFKTRLQHFLLRIPACYLNKHADIVFSYGGKITQILRQRLHIPQDKIAEIPTGIEQRLIAEDITPFHFPIRFVFTGRYEERKGIRNLNEALLQLQKKKQPFEMHFIGDIPDSMKITGKNIFYHGTVYQYQKIQQLLRQADVLICPSFSEGMPNVIVEAMANGLTVMATDVGAVRELVNAQTGYLLESNDVSLLYRSMCQVSEAGEEDIQNRKKGALRHVRLFVWENIIDKLLKELDVRFGK